MTHDELRGLIPLLALDALEPAEEAELVAHLKICRECSEVLAGHESTVGSLGLSVPPIAASMQLRERILSEASRTQQFVPERAATVTRLGDRRKVGARVASALAMAAVLAFGAVGTSQLMEKNDRIESQQELLAAQRRALDLASAGSVIVPMSPAAAFSDVEGSVIVSDQSRSAAVLMTGLDDPGQKVYTLWLSQVDGEPRNVAEFVPDETGLAVVNLDEPVAERDTVAVTLEPRRGLKSPTGPVIGSAVRA